MLLRMASRSNCHCLLFGHMIGAHKNFAIMQIDILPLFHFFLLASCRASDLIVLLHVKRSVCGCEKESTLYC